MWRTLVRWGAGLALMVGGASAGAVTPDKFSPAEFVAPVCPALYEMKAADQPCEPKAAEIAKLEISACEYAGFTFTPGAPAQAASAGQPEKAATPSNCSVGNAKAPVPSCKLIPSYGSSLSGGKCTYTKVAATSAPGNFVGDCIRVDGVPAGMDAASGDHYVVTSQRTSGNDEDTLLTVVKARKRGLLGTGQTFTCGSLGGATKELSANALLDAGARRYGFAFGALALPYKYFHKESAFVTGIPVGLYAGYRWGQIGSAFTLAVGATIGSVKADTLDANDKTKVTGSAEVTAIGTTVGFIFDIAKARNTRPFKIGLFYGSDRVSSDQKTIRYAYNKRPWFAFQVGYDFTEN